jgi:hypothetical protein
LITATLTDCIAAVPSSGGRRTSAFITNVEKAKRTPAISPDPIAATPVSAVRKGSCISPLAAPAAEKHKTPSTRPAGS